MRFAKTSHWHSGIFGHQKFLMEENPQMKLGEGVEMSFLDHLEELRWHIVRSLLAVSIGTILAFVFKGFVFDTVIFGPKKGDFPTYRLLCYLSNEMSALLPSLFPNGAICIGQNFPGLLNLTMTGQFMAHITTALIVGFIIGAPYIFWEIWRFISPGMHKKERKMARGFVAAASFLFFCGILFGYYVVCPLSINFLLNYQISESVVTQPTLSTYISLVTTIVIACGAVFEMPLLVYFLTRAGILTPEVLKAYRKHALVGALILSALITPPDAFSQILVSIPIMVLYQVSIRISALVKRQQAN